MGYDMQSILTDIMIYPGYTQIFEENRYIPAILLLVEFLMVLSKSKDFTHLTVFSNKIYITPGC